MLTSTAGVLLKKIGGGSAFTPSTFFGMIWLAVDVRQHAVERDHASSSASLDRSPRPRPPSAPSWRLEIRCVTRNFEKSTSRSLHRDAGFGFGDHGAEHRLVLAGRSNDTAACSCSFWSSQLANLRLIHDDGRRRCSRYAARRHQARRCGGASPRGFAAARRRHAVAGFAGAASTPGSPPPGAHSSIAIDGDLRRRSSRATHPQMQCAWVLLLPGSVEPAAPLRAMRKRQPASQPKLHRAQCDRSLRWNRLARKLRSRCAAAREGAEMKKLLFGAFLAIVVSATPAWAQDEKPVQVNHRWRRSSMPLRISKIDFGTGGNFIIGVDLHPPSAPHVGLQVEYGYNHLAGEDKTIPTSITPGGVRHRHRADRVASQHAVHRLQRRLARPATGRFSLYGIGGFGMYYRSVSLTTPDRRLHDDLRPVLVRLLSRRGRVSITSSATARAGTLASTSAAASASRSATREVLRRNPLALHVGTDALRTSAGIEHKANGQYLPVTFGFRF